MNISDSITWILWKYYALKKALKIGQFNMGANDERRYVNSIRQDRGSRFDNHEGLSYLVNGEIAFAAIEFIFGLHNITSERSERVCYGQK